MSLAPVAEVETMLFAHNPTGEKVRADFFGYGTFVIEPGETVELPDEVAKAWQDPNMWGGRPCPLEFTRPGRPVPRPKPAAALKAAEEAK